MSRCLAPLLGSIFVGCADTTPRWDLTHDRVIAVRATPPGLAPNETGQLDALISVASQVVAVAPTQVTVSGDTAAPVRVEYDGSTWHVVAGDADALVRARQARALPPGADVEVELALALIVGGTTKRATKRVTLGTRHDNPAPDLAIDGVSAGRFVLPPTTTVRLETAAAAGETVDWLTSIGSLEDDDDAIAHLTVEAEGTGVLVTVRRAGTGVGWAIAELEAR